MHQNIHIEKINDASLENKGIEAAVLRLDKKHPIVSGNKIFKLRPYLLKAQEEKRSTIINLGGHYSNHLHATAFAAREHGLKAIGLLKGSPPKKWSETLKDCQAMGMELVFMQNLQDETPNLQELQLNYPDALIIPQGGYGNIGALGASAIMSLPNVENYNIIMAASGTGTMGAGLIIGARNDQKIILVSALKNNLSIKEEIKALLPEEKKHKNLIIEHRFHLGGYAKKNNLLFETMNRFYQKHGIPTDHVYTGKLVFAFEQLVGEGVFPPSSKILLIHSGGMQGNRSLRNNELCFEIKD